MEKKLFPTQASDYDLLEEIGRGAFAVVYRAICKPLNQTVAVKCLDLDSCNSNLTNVYAEAQLMSLVDHPNIIKSYCSFIVDHFLWVVMPYMDGGSCLHIMKIRYPEGLPEPMIAVILKETLKGLDYLHRQQQIHRDVKAGNILIDTSGAVKLGDFGTSACMFNRGDRERCRKTVTGSPCWMAPEMLEERYGADIWSFGITALELAHGHAPFSKFPPQKVLLMTLTSAAPCLNPDKDKNFSKGFKDVVNLCLNKEPSKRPTTEKLLKLSYFKQTKFNSTLVQKLLNGLGPLWEREKILRDKDAALLASKKSAFLQEEEKSRNEYKRGVSCWNFDIESLKDEAATIHDDDTSVVSEIDPVSVNAPNQDEVVLREGGEVRQRLILNKIYFRKPFEREPQQFGRFGVFDGDLELESPGWHVVRPVKNSEDARLPTIDEDKGRTGSTEKGLDNFDSPTSSLIMDGPAGDHLKRYEDDKEYKRTILSLEQKYKDNPLSSRYDSAVQSRDAELREMDPGLLPSKSGVSCAPASNLAPQLKTLLLQTAKQYEVLADLLRIASPGEAMSMPLCTMHSEGPSGQCSEVSNLALEPDLNTRHQIHELQIKIASLTHELTFVKQRNMQLERQLNALYNKQEEERIKQEAEKY
ncbi:hypothetical protein KP509_01G004700 [Ceratopteris richardii]|uniref:Protein kinase domain-containing protein n=1 Tax=Ceratopteris richardii TaxID=49495 RepID=A0A8T2VIE4_CERRI|nr:hypothetical protein KP509_01G004700 [Ceratopteris richardii]